MLLDADIVAAPAAPRNGWTQGDRIHFGLGVAGIAVVTVFFLVVLRAAPETRLDSAGCLSGHAPPTQTLILIDNTDPFSPAQIARFQKVLEGAYNDVAPWGMLTIASIRGNLPADVLFSKCSPAKGQSFFESLRRNQDWLELKRNYEQQFQRPVEDLLAHMPLNKITPNSPIIGSIEGVLARLGDRWSGSSKRNLIIFSDLMENTYAFSQYGSTIRSFAQARRAVPYIRAARLDLRNTDISVFYLTGRAANQPFQGKMHEKFWRDLFASSGGEVRDWAVLPAGPHPAQNTRSTVKGAAVAASASQFAFKRQPAGCFAPEQK